ncbi:Xylose isomerase-like TIM barrel [Aquisphaera giovannonii]|uniref:Xylose isomerase-like TIM barrel n=1 Tax=Aquisphaera giovannonii TaxID=406548 RepID=A0A5B9VZU0_9BACT|nr:TIM barrel protein [Aquisphaera giovannonii]QEH33501.1 Xylose isomerase-like TIM barrel [Aquisphaera giovannonii]
MMKPTWGSKHVMFASWNARAVGLKLGARESIELAARAGFGGVDLLVRDLDAEGEDPDALRERMDDLGLRGGAWPLPVAWKGDESRFVEDLRSLPRYARLAQRLGLTCTGTWVLPEVAGDVDGRLPVDEQVARTIDMHVERLGAVAAILDDHGQAMGLEIMGPVTARTGRSAPFIGRYRELLDCLRPLAENHANVGVLLDAFHLFASGEARAAYSGWGYERVVWVHVADPVHADRDTLLDTERTLPGITGLADCRCLLLALQHAGFKGPVTVEPLAECEVLRGLKPVDTARSVAASIFAIWPES